MSVPTTIEIQTFLIKSSPLFVKDVAYNDVVTLKCDDVGGLGL
jgi:hypothetical protein